MAKFKKKSESTQEIPTAALPDIIFMLLFFFMVTTVMRETTVLVEQNIPRAEQLVKLEKKKLVTYLYIGKPKDPDVFGTEPLIQANDAFVAIDGIVQWVNTEKDKLSEVERDQITISLKVDENTKMGIIVDVQTELREANARKIIYAAPTKANDN